MKACKILLASIILSSLFCCNAQNGTGIHTKIEQAEKALNQSPNNQQAWQKLYTIMNENYTQLTATERSRLRKILEQYGKWSAGTLYTAGEPGTKIIIKGHLINTAGKPIANAALHIFQTDSRGYYTPLDSAEKKMGEPDARLFCFLKSDSNGNFLINTIRPASYPKQYNGRTIPQHIHLNIESPRYKNKNLQMVFIDDPAMNTYWQKWAVENGFPILTLNNAAPQRMATIEITLTQ